MVAASQVLTSNARLTEALWWMSVKQLIQPMHESDERRKSRLHENMVRSSRSSTKEKTLNYSLMYVVETSSLPSWTLSKDLNNVQLTLLLLLLLRCYENGQPLSTQTN